MVQCADRDGSTNIDKKNCCTFVVVLNTTDSPFCAPIYITSVKNKYLWFLWPSRQALVETSQFRFGFGKMQIGADLVSTIKPGKTKPYRPVHGSVQENLHSVDPSTRIGNSVVLSRLTRLTRRKTYIEVLNVKVTMFKYYYFSCHYQIAVKIKSLYLTNNTHYLTSNTTRVVQ